MRLYELGKRLVEQGHKLTVVTMQHSNVKEHETLDGIEIYHVGPIIENPPKRRLYDFVRFFFAIRKWLKTNEYDVVCAEGMSIIPAYLFSPAPVIATVHDVSVGGKDQWISKSLLSRIAEWLTLHMCVKKIITVSNAMKQAIIEKGVPQEKVVVIYNAVDARALDKIPEKKIDKNTIMFIGRFVPHKHVDDLITAFSFVVKKIPDSKLLLVGNGPEEEKLRQMAKEYNLNEKVGFATSADKTASIGMLKSVSVLVLPSTREGFGIVLAEAGAVEVPVIAYDLPAVREVVVNNKTGILVEHNPQSLAEAIVAVLNNQKKAKMMGKTARKYITEKFSWDKSAKKLVDVLE